VTSGVTGLGIMSEGIAIGRGEISLRKRTLKRRATGHAKDGPYAPKCA
jgi:hypothetical protein